MGDHSMSCYLHEDIEKLERSILLVMTMEIYIKMELILSLIPSFGTLPGVE